MPFEFQPVPLNMVPVRFPDRHRTSFSSHSVIRCHRPTSTPVSFTALGVRAGARAQSEPSETRHLRGFCIWKRRRPVSEGEGLR